MATTRRPTRTSLLALLCASMAGASLTGAAGCAKVTPAQATGGSGVGPGAGGRPGGGGNGGSVRTGTGGGGGGLITANPDAGDCQVASTNFEPKIPTVYILVDRSGSVFTNDTSGIFFTLRTAVLEVVQQLQGQVRFGLGVFTGVAGAQCLMLSSVPTGLNNYDMIAATYNGLGKPGFKAETPAAQAIAMVKQALMADAGDGKKYMLFVTDAETDYCNDPNTVCPMDSVTYLIQNMFDAGFGTFIFGLPSDQTTVSPAALQAWANAGVGMPVAPPPIMGGNPPAIELYYQCQSEAAWKDIWTAAGRTGMIATATYGAAGGNAPVFKPDPMDKAALVDQIGTVVAGVKSCLFDLNNIGGKKITADPANLAKAKILVGPDKDHLTEVPLSNSNGWHLATDTAVELVGPACDNWKQPENLAIDFRFPCELIID